MLLDGFSLLTYWTHLGEYEQQCDESDLVSSTCHSTAVLYSAVLHASTPCPCTYVHTRMQKPKKQADVSGLLHLECMYLH